MSSLLDSLLKQSAVANKTVDDAKSNLTETPKVELVGVNAPEFENATSEEDGVDFDALAQSVDLDTAPQEEVSSEDPMEQAYANKPQSSIRLPVHDDGLDDDEEALTEYHAVTQAEDVVEAEDTAPQPEFLTQEDWDDYKAQNGIVEEALDEDGEPVAWNRKPFTSRYFNFGGRTVNSLARENLNCFDDIQGWAYSELKAIKGFGQGCLDELLEILEAEKQTDWLIKRKRKAKSTNGVVTPKQTNIEADTETSVEAPQEKVIEGSVSAQTDELGSEEDAQAGLRASEEVSDHAPISERDAEAVEGSSQESVEAQAIEGSSEDLAEKQTANPIKQEVKSEDEEAKSTEEVIVQEPESDGQRDVRQDGRNSVQHEGHGTSKRTVAIPTDRELSKTVDSTRVEATVTASNDAVSSSKLAEGSPEIGLGSAPQINVDSVKTVNFKVLVMGNASAMNDKVRVATFEQVYAEAIREICTQSSVPSISMIDYNKGWQALASTIRQNGWPEGVDVLNVSKSFMGRSDIILELRLLADLVIDG